MKYVYILKDKTPGLGYFVIAVHATEEAAIVERKRLIDIGKYKAHNLEVFMRVVMD